MFVAMVKIDKFKTYPNIANENKPLWPFWNFQLGWLHKNQAFVCLKRFCPNGCHKVWVCVLVVADLMTQVLSNTRYRGRGLGCPCPHSFKMEVLILKKKNHVHLKEVCKELNAQDCIKFPYYRNIITLRISLDFNTFDRITEWVRDHNMSSASVSLLKQGLPRPFIFFHLHPVKLFVICVLVQVVADKVTIFK